MLLQPTALTALYDSGVRKFVMTGESGSGKSELGLQCALRLAQHSGERVHFLDLDATKPVFRAREARRVMEENGIGLCALSQILDIPQMVPATQVMLQSPPGPLLIDLGGGTAGVRHFAQYQEWLHAADTALLVPINIYRGDGDAEKTVEMLDSLTGAFPGCRPYILSNPNFGPATTLREVLEGHRKTEEMLCGTMYPILLLCAMERICAPTSAPEHPDSMLFHPLLQTITKP